MRNVEEILHFAENLIYAQTGEHFNDLQRTILRECWEQSKKTYDSIAAEQGYSANYIKQGVAPKLWRLLSSVLGEKVTKSNLHSVFERRLINNNFSSAQDSVIAVEKKQDNILIENSDRKLKSNITQQPTTSYKSPELELPLDSVPLNSLFYIERIPHESRCYQEILRSGAFIRIKAPRQMGKSSLMHRILAYAKEQNYHTGLIHLQQIETRVLDDLDYLLRWFCALLTRQLKLDTKPNDYWDEMLGSKMSCTCYLQEQILEKIECPLVIALEEVNQIIEHPQTAKEFLTLIRFWHERTKIDPTWQKLRLVMVHSTEIYIPLDINQSPLNVGLRIELQPFTQEQVEDAIARHGLIFDSSQVQELMSLTAGHPYLIRRALYHLARQEITIEELFKTASTDTGIYKDYLHRHLHSLQRYSNLKESFAQVLKSDIPVTLEQIQGFKLHSMGLVNLDGDRVTVSCDLYQRYFGDKLI